MEFAFLLPSPVQAIPCRLIEVFQRLLPPSNFWYWYDFCLKELLWQQIKVSEGKNGIKLPLPLLHLQLFQSHGPPATNCTTVEFTNSGVFIWTWAQAPGSILKEPLKFLVSWFLCLQNGGDYMGTRDCAHSGLRCNHFLSITFSGIWLTKT